MKVAVTSKGVSLNADVDLRFGRAEQFIIFNTETEEFEVVGNSQNLNAAKGAGIQAAETLSRLDVDCLISGHCGPNAYRTLNAAGIKVYTGASGKVSDMLKALEAGELQPAEDADKTGHWV